MFVCWLYLSIESVILLLYWNWTMLGIKRVISILVILHDISLKNFCASPSRFGFMIWRRPERLSVWLFCFSFPSGLAPSGVLCFAFQRPVLFGTAKVEDLSVSPKFIFSFFEDPETLFSFPGFISFSCSAFLAKASAKIEKEGIPCKSAAINLHLSA